MTGPLPANPTAQSMDAIEQAFSNLSRGAPEDKTYFRKALAALARSLAEYLSLQLPPDGDAWEGLLSAGSLGYARDLLAAAIVRVMFATRHGFEVNEVLRGRAWIIVDDVFGEDLYPDLSIAKDDQTFRKEQKLSVRCDELDQKIEAFTGSLTSLQALPVVRHEFMKLLRSRKYSPLLGKWLPQNLVSDLRLQGLFQALEDYSGATTGPHLREGYQYAIETCRRYSEEAHGFGSHYSRGLLGVLADRLSELASNDFTTRVATRLPVIELKQDEKKHPLGTLHAPVSVSLILTNSGDGDAFELEVAVENTTSNIVPLAPARQYLANLQAHSDMRLELQGNVKELSDRAILEVLVKWRDVSGATQAGSYWVEIESQRATVDWNEAAGLEPYDIEPVQSQAELIGRTDIINQLAAKASSREIGSAYIFGQKRVGKTSVAKTFYNSISELCSPSHKAIYLEGGDYIDPDPEKTIQNLGRSIVSAVKRLSPSLRHLPDPTFDTALAPLGAFLDSTLETDPDLRLLIILDEFDELPLALYQRGNLGNAFFLTLRSLGAKSRVGFILVGSEKMDFIFSIQGTQLNKWDPIRIDYFSKRDNWPEYSQLVRAPVARLGLEYSDAAVEKLHEYTAGNPYFTKLICKALFHVAVKRRDSFISERDVISAAEKAVGEIGSNSFQHFWDDGIFEPPDRAEAKSILRRRVLIGIAQAMRTSPQVSAHDVAAKRIVRQSAHDTEQELRDLERRKILVRDGDRLEFTVRLFQRWLIERGVEEIVTTFSTQDAELVLLRQEEAKFVSAEELNRLTAEWSPYRGREIGAERVRAWLTQFGTNDYQRLMFRILENLRFYSDLSVRQRLREAHDIVRRGLVRQIQPGQKKRGDVIVSYLDSPGKSGAHYAKLYADENEIYYDLVVERGELGERMAHIQVAPRALVLLDDFVGSGDSAGTNLKSLLQSIDSVIRDGNWEVYFIAVVGFGSAKMALTAPSLQSSHPVHIHYCETLDEGDKSFSEASRVFPDPSERKLARDIAYEKGRLLESRRPLGYGDCEALVIFQHTCPNNSLPILWAESKGVPWVPLFPR